MWCRLPLACPEGDISLLGVLVPLFIDHANLTDDEIKHKASPLVKPFFQK